MSRTGLRDDAILLTEEQDKDLLSARDSGGYAPVAKTTTTSVHSNQYFNGGSRRCVKETLTEEGRVVERMERIEAQGGGGGGREGGGREVERESGESGEKGEGGEKWESGEKGESGERERGSSSRPNTERSRRIILAVHEDIIGDTFWREHPGIID